MPIRRRLHRWYTRWRADAQYRRLFRQQLWRQRREHLRWAVRRMRVEQGDRWQRRSTQVSGSVHNVGRRGSSAASTVVSRGSSAASTVRDQLPVVAGNVRTRGSSLSSRLAGTLERARSNLSGREWGRPWRRLGSGLSSGLTSVSTRLRSRRPSPRLVVALAVLLIGGVVGYAVIRSVGDLGDRRPSADGTARSAADESGRGPRVPGLSRPGIFVSVAADDAGQLTVVEQARSKDPIAELLITPPPQLDGARNLPSLEDLKVSVDGKRVATVDTVEVTTVVALDRPAKLVELSYRVVGASARSNPATWGRATLSLRPALASTLGDARTVLEVRGMRVRNLVCVDLPPKRQLCGIARRDGWRTKRLDAASSAVVALVDLPGSAA